LVRQVQTNGKVTKARAWCELRDNKLPGKVADRMCDVTVQRTSAKKGYVRIVAAPTCTQGLKISAKITAKKADHPRSTWRKTWRVTAAEPIACRIRGTG
jgi:hypothetical protein